MMSTADGISARRSFQTIVQCLLLWTSKPQRDSRTWQVIITDPIAPPLLRALRIVDQNFPASCTASRKAAVSSSWSTSTRGLRCWLKSMSVNRWDVVFALRVGAVGRFWRAESLGPPDGWVPAGKTDSEEIVSKASAGSPNQSTVWCLYSRHFWKA